MEPDGPPPLPREHPFDAAAEEYDAGFGTSAPGRLVRYRFAEHVQNAAKPGARLLDIGCGTGEDAVWFARGGFEVTAVEPSPGMLAIASAKARALGTDVRFVRASAEEVDLAAEPFDLVCSNFGAMNCVPLNRWRQILSPLVKPGGRLILVLMGKRPMPEGVRSGFDAWRSRGRLEASVEGARLPVHYPGPGAVTAALFPDFTLRSAATLGLLIPPPSASGWAARNAILFAGLAAAEWVMGRAPFLCDFADHFLLDFERRQVVGRAS